MANKQLRFLNFCPSLDPYILPERKRERYQKVLRDWYNAPAGSENEDLLMNSLFLFAGTVPMKRRNAPDAAAHGKLLSYRPKPLLYRHIFSSIDQYDLPAEKKQAHNDLVTAWHNEPDGSPEGEKLEQAIFQSGALLVDWLDGVCLVRLPEELLMMIIRMCYENKKATFDGFRNATGRSFGGRFLYQHKYDNVDEGRVYGGVDELSQVNTLFRRLCLEVQHADFFITARVEKLSNEVAAFATDNRKDIVRGTRALSIRGDLEPKGRSCFRRSRLTGGAGPNFPRSLASLAARITNLVELDLFVHSSDVRELRKSMGTARGSSRNRMPSVKALRFITDKPCSLAFIPIAFPNIRTFSTRIHCRYTTRAWHLLNLRAFRSLKSLEVVQLFRHVWSLDDMMMISRCFPYVERLLVMGELHWKWTINLEMLSRALTGLPRLRNFVHCGSHYRDAGRYGYAGAPINISGSITSSITNAAPATKGDMMDAWFALALFQRRELSHIDTIGLCMMHPNPTDCKRGLCERSARIYRRGSDSVNGVTGVDVIRDYHSEMQGASAAPVEFWFNGEPTVMRCDRHWLKRSLLITTTFYRHAY